MTRTLPKPVSTGPHGSVFPVAPSRRRRDREARTAWWLLSPAGLVMLVFTVAPIGYLAFTSFTDYDQCSLFTGFYRMVGLRQYSDLVADPGFWHALERSILFTAAMVAGSVLMGVAVAQLLTRLGRVLRTTTTVVLRSGEDL